MAQSKILLLLAMLMISTLGACQSGPKEKATPTAKANMTYNIKKSEADWRKELTPEQYKVMRDKGTERAFSGKYNKHKEEGVYTCAACGQELFSSETKFDSGTGWPSYYKPISKQAVAEVTDTEYGMVRTEVVCSNCGGHLGHVFNDGPKPTGLRYCLNSVSLDFVKKDQ
jgi:peptide-methionine (R)-S-oxide reductase